MAILVYNQEKYFIINVDLKVEESITKVKLTLKNAENKEFKMSLNAPKTFGEDFLAFSQDPRKDKIFRLFLEDNGESRWDTVYGRNITDPEPSYIH